jgi:hypothetical protein
MDSIDPINMSVSDIDIETLKKVTSPSTIWMEEFYLPEQSALNMQRLISNSGFSLNKAMSIANYNAIDKERGLLLEQALSTQTALADQRNQALLKQSTYAQG